MRASQADGMSVDNQSVVTQGRHALFRQEAIDYHFRDSESRGIVAARPRWSRAAVAVAVALAVATIVYLVVEHEVVHALLDRALR